MAQMSFNENSKSIIQKQGNIQMNIKPLSTHICKDVAESLQYLDSVNIKDESNNPEVILLLTIQLDEIFQNLSQIELQKLSRSCRNKSIVLVFESKSQDKFSIYWKSKEMQNFLILAAYNDTPVVTDRNFYYYLATFLAECLACGHLGLLSSIRESAEKGGNVQLHLIADSRDYNLLLIAAEAGKKEIVEILLQQTLETVAYEHGHEIRAQDLAWDASHYDVVLTLMEIGVTYPKGFDINKCSTKLRKFCEKSEELHVAVVAGNEDEIMKILKDNCNVHPFYNRFNDSAAKTALNNKRIDIYELLVTRGVFLGRHEALHGFWGHFSEVEREMLRKIHLNNSIHKPEKHINDLTNLSSASHDDMNAQSNLNLTKYSFEILNQISFIRILLMIVAASRKLNKIIFDFKSTSVDVVDPTVESNTRGTFYTKGIICIGANFLMDQLRENETFGTLAHELCHFAVSLVYRNMARPYKRKDRERRKEFAKIARICEENREKEELVDLALNEPKNRQHAELIVRVPHLMALYHNQPEKLKMARVNFPELFEFYEQKVVPDMNLSLPRIAKEIQRMERQILKNKIIAIVTVVLSVVVLISGFFGMHFLLNKPNLKFNELSRADQVKVGNAIVFYKNVQIQFKDLFAFNSSIYADLKSDLIKQMLDGHPLDFNDPEMVYIDMQVTLDWKNLTGNLKNKFLTSNFTFQKENLIFKKLHEKIPKAFKFLTSDQIIDVLDGMKLIVGEMIPNDTAFYIERSFLSHEFYLSYHLYDGNKDELIEDDFFKFHKNFVNRNVSMHNQFYYANQLNERYQRYFDIRYFKSFHESSNQVIENVGKTKVFILTDEAGTGKTTTFKQFTMKIKKNNPTRWVSYIDLQEYVKFYKSESLEDILGLMKDILNLESKTKFEMKIFEELYMLGGVVLVWNGFDEISPTYSDFVANVSSLIQNQTDNSQYICTRNLYTHVLVSKLNTFAHTLIPFDADKQAEFLKKYFKASKIDEEEIQNYIDKVFKIVNDLSAKIDKYDYREDLTTPLLLEMISGLIANKVEIYKSENLWEIYEKFIETKLEIWGKKFKLEKIYTDYRNLDVLEIFQMFALKSEISLINQDIFEPGTRFPFFIQKLKIMRQKLLKNDEISQMGILHIYEKNEFKFAHKTFAEFFVAQFFIDNIYNARNIDDHDTLDIIHLFIDVLKKYPTKQVMITKFMNSYLQKQNSSDTKPFDYKIVNIFKNQHRNFFFEFLVSDKPEKIYEFLFKFFEKDHNLLVNLLHVDDDETFYTAMYNRACFDFNNYNLFCEKINRTRVKEISKNYLTNNEYEKFIHGKNQKGIILYSLYLFRNKVSQIDGNRAVIHDEYHFDDKIVKNGNITFLFEFLEKNLTKNELKEFYTSKSSPALWEDDDLLDNLNFWAFFPSLIHEERIKVLSSFLLRYVSSRFASHTYIIPRIFRDEHNWNNLEIFEIFSRKNILQWAILNSKQYMFENYWNFFTKHTSEDQQKVILLRRVNGECFRNLKFVPYKSCYELPPYNIFEISILFSYSFYFEFSKNLYERYFNNFEMRKMILGSKELIFHLIQEKSGDKFADYLKSLFKGYEKDLKEFLLRKIESVNLNIFNITENDEFLDHNFKPFSELLQSL